MKTPTKTLLSVAVSTLSFTGGAQAFWRMPCRSRTGLARIDPLMNFGEVSDHVHAIHGGGNFGMDTKPEDLVSSNCTSCEVTQDKSAYWTPSLHFMYSNGTTVVVPQVGGMLAYYLLYTDPNDSTGQITAFPDGFNMISGDKNLRNFTGAVPDLPKSEWTGNETTQFALSQKALGFNCLNYAAAPEGSLYRHFMPDKDYLDANCLDGIRLELMFPSCWNGKDIDSPDHKAHVAFPDQVMTGTCPEGFETKLPSLFYETIWNTYAFAGQDGQFLLSQGDPTGYGYHGDFMMGWDAGVLQQAVDTCTDLSGLIQDCPIFKTQSDDDAAQCTFNTPSEIENEEPAGPRSGLACGIPIQSGPAPATKYPIILADNETQMPSSAAMTEASPSASTTSAAPVVPVLSYSPANTATAVENTVLAPSSPTPSSAASPSSVYPAETATADVNLQPTSSSASPSSPAQNQKNVVKPVTTAAASLASAATDTSGVILSTSYLTQSGEVLEVVIEQVVVTVTMDEPAPQKIRRHMAGHSQRRQERKERWGL